MIQNCSSDGQIASIAQLTDIGLSRLLELVRFRAAQLLGSTEAMETHSRQLLHLGENNMRMGQVYGWAKSTHFTSRERMAFALCEAILLLDNVEIIEPLLLMARQDLTQEEMLGIVITVSTVIDWSQSKKPETAYNRSEAA